MTQLQHGTNGAISGSTPSGAAPIDVIARSSDVAFINGEDRWSYDRFATGIDRLAAGLVARGIKPGDRVALHLRNGPEIAVAYYACFRLGAIAAPLNLRFKPAELAEVLGRLKPSLYLGNADLYALVAGLDTAILGARDRYVVGATEDRSARPWTDLQGDAATTPPPGKADLHAPVVLLLTSGTTCQSKLVAHSISTLTRAADQFACLGFNTGGVHAFLRPMVHASGLFFLLYATRLGMTHVMLDPAAPEAILDAIERHRCTYLPVPVFSCDALIEIQGRKPRDLSSLLACGISADICPPGRQDAFRSVVGLPLRCWWASTEGTFPFTYGLQSGATGQARPDTEVKLVADDGATVAPGEIGELMLRGPHVALGYWQGPGKVDGLVDGWYRSGDMMRQDQNGEFWFVARRKDLIVRGGSNISPVEVEHVLAQHPDVRDAAVIGVPDAVFGQRVVGFVRLKEGVGTDNLDRILKSTRDRLADYKVPERLLSLAEIPRNAFGKIDRKALAMKV